MRFWDASAVIPLCVLEAHSSEIRRLYTEDPEITVWWGTALECRSALARIRREGKIELDGEFQALAPLEMLMAVWSEMIPSEEIRNQAFRAVAIHPLKSADALQLAAALVWAGGNPRAYDFVCLDNQLRTAAKKEGFVILP